MTILNKLVLCGFAIVASIATTNALSQEGAVPIISFDQSHPLVADTVDLPMVEVYSNGLVKVYRARGFKNPGEYELRLTDAELTELIQLAQNSDLAALNGAQVSSLPSTNLFYVSDPTTTTLGFNRVSDSSALALVDSSSETELQSVALTDLIVASNDAPGVAPFDEIKNKLIELFGRVGER